MTRKTKRDWLIAGTELLAAAGAQGVTIEALCQQLQVTKGSFYHHFEGQEAFKENLLAFYEEEGTLDLIERLADVPTPLEKLRRLTEMVVAASTAFVAYPEVAIRAWALQDEAVRVVLMRVDGRRLDYVRSLCLEITNDQQHSLIMARHLYAILVGSEQMQPALRGEDLRALFDEYLRLYDLE